MGRGSMRGGRGLMKGYGPPGHGRGRPKDAPMNGFAPIRYSFVGGGFNQMGAIKCVQQINVLNII